MGAKRKAPTSDAPSSQQQENHNETNVKKKQPKYNPHIDGKGNPLTGCWKQQIADSNAEPNQFKIATWNVNGLRAVLRSTKLEAGMSDFEAYIKEEQPDILCLNETKIGQDLEETIEASLSDYTFYHVHSEKKAYAGVAVLIRKSSELASKVEAQRSGIGEEEHDSEGRTITLVFPGLCLVASYVANSGQGLKRLDYRINKFDPSMQKYLKSLQDKYARPVLWAGDLNVAYEEIDIWNSKGNQKSAGHTPEERESFGKLLEDGNWIDVWRDQNPQTRSYTYWSMRFPKARADNLGWRLDYFVCSQTLKDNLGPCYIRDRVKGSDHCPILLVLNKEVLLDPQKESTEGIEGATQEEEAQEEEEEDSGTEDQKPPTDDED